MSEKGRPLYRENAQEDLKEMHKHKLVDETGDGIKSVFSGYFQEYIESALRGSSPAAKFCKLLDREGIRTNVFNIENITAFYNLEDVEIEVAVNRARYNFSNLFELFYLSLKAYNSGEDNDTLQNLITEGCLPGNSELNYSVIYEATMSELESGDYEEELEDLFGNSPSPM